MRDGKLRMAELAARIRSVVGLDPRVTEKFMFGGQTFLLNGHILASCKADGRTLLQLGAEATEAALQQSGVAPMTMNGRQAKGFVWLGADATEDDAELAQWLHRAEQYVGGLAAKTK